MSKCKKNLIIILVLALIVLVPMGYLTYRHYEITRLQFSFDKMKSGTHREGPKVEFLSYGYLGEMPIDFKLKLNQITIWSRNAVYDFTRNYTPVDINVSGEVKDGKTIFKYFGTVTTKDGETVDYLNEGVFDFVLVPDEELPKHPY